MRISTTPLILICSVLLLGFTSGAFAQNGAPGTPPKFQVTHLQHTCGPGTPTTGSITLTITDGDPAQGSLTVSAQVGINPPITQTIPIPPGFPTTPIVTTLNGLSGNPAGGARSYLVLVQDADNSSISDGGANYNIFNFQTSLGSKVDNTSANCTTPNGAINVTLAGNTGVTERPILYSWTGPAGFTDPGTKDLTGLAGGDYTLTYKDSNSPATSCTLGPIHINDPNPPDYNNLTNGVACGGTALGIDLNSLKKATSVTASSFELVNLTIQGGLTAGGGIVTAPGTILTATDLADDTWLNTDVAARDVTYTLKTLLCGTAGNTITVKYSISPQPAYNDIPLTSPGICSKTAPGAAVNLDPAHINLTADSYTVTGMSVGSLTAVSGITTATPYAATNTSLADDVWQNTGTTTANATYTIVPKIGTCAGSPFTVTIKIIPQPSAPLAPKTICSNQAVNFDIAAHYAANGNNLAGTTFQWQAADNLQVTGETLTTQTTTTINDVLVNTTTSAKVVDYSVTPTTGTCVGDPFIVRVTVNAEPTAPPAVKTICSKDAVAFDLQNHITTNGNGISSTFTWFADDNTSVTGESLTTQTSGTINDPLVNVSSGPQPVVYHVTPKSVGNCVGTAFTVTVTVNPEPVSGPQAKTICSGDNVAFNLQTGAIDSGSGNAIANTTFSWIVLTDNPSVTGESLSAKTTQSITDVLTNTSAIDQPVTYTVTPTSPAPAGCVGSAFTVTVTVSAKPAYVDYIHPTAVCADPIGIDLDARKGATSVLADSYDVVVLDHTNLTPAGGSPALTLVTGALTGEIADDVWGNATATSHDVLYEITPKKGSCIGLPFHVTVTISPQPDYASKSATACSSDAIGYNLNSAKNALSVTATIFTITNIVPSDPAVVATTGPAALNTPLSATAIQNDVWKNTTAIDQTVIYTVVPKEGSCSGAPFDITVTIHPEPVYTNAVLPDLCSEVAIGLNLNDQKVATSIAATQFTFTTVSGALIPVGTTTTTGTGNNMIIADDQWRNVTIAAIPLEYTITPITADGCDGVPFKVTVNINPQPDYKPYNNDNVPGGICAVPLAIDLTALQKPNTAPATSFTFTVAPDPALALVTDGGTPTDLSDDVWSNPTAANHDVVYKVIPKNGCDGDEFDVRVTILPTPAYNPYTNDNAPGGVCSRTPINVDITTLKKATSAAAASFAITINSNGMIQTAGTATPSDLTDDAWENTNTGTLDVTYSIIPKTATCDGAPFDVTVTIKPEPSTIPDMPWTICTGNAVGFNLQTDGINTAGNGVASTFKWQAAFDNTNVSGETLALTSTGTISDVLTNNVTTDQDVTYNVTPTSTGGCVGQMFTVTVTVAAKPVLGTNNDADVCSGSPVNYAIAVTPSSANVTWFAVMDYPTITGESLTLQPGAIINDVLTNTGTTAVTVDYTVTPFLGGCVGTAKTIQITVYPGLIADAGADQTICDDFTGYFLAGASISGAATSFTWFIETNPGDATLDPPTDVNDPSTAQFHATIEGNYVLRLETNTDPSGLCTQGVDRVTITVTKRPLITAGPPLQSKTICGNDLVAYEILMDQRDFNQEAVFTWPTPTDTTGVANAKPSPPGGIPMGPVGTIHINDELRNELNGNIGVIYRVTASAGLCVGNTTDIIITVKPSPVVAFGQTKTICSGETVDYEILLAPANTPAGTKFSWPDPDGAGSATSRKDILADPAGTKHILDTLYHFDAAGLPATVRYQIISQGVNGCYGRTRDLDIVVNSGAIANAGAPQAICSDGVLTLSTASVQGSATFNWTILSQPGTDGVITNGATAQASTFKGTTPGVYKLALTTGAPTAGACGAVTDVVSITVKPIGDPACTGTGTGPCTTTATITVVDATCNNNDGTIKVENVTGGTAPYTYRLNGTIVNLPPDFTFKGLTANTYAVDIIDATSCVKTFTTNVSWPGFVAHYTPKITDPDCNANGTNGSIRLVISDPGSFEFAFTADLVNEPLTYNKVGDSVILVPNVSAGDYAIWMRPLGAGLKCTTKVFTSVGGVRAVTYNATATNVICFSEQVAVSVSDIKGAPGLPFSYTLTNTNDNSVRTGSISASQALSTYSITGVTKGSYSLLISQDQSSVTACTSPIAGSPVALIVDAPVAALDTLYIKKTISFPDLASGAALVGVAPSGREPYEVRLELVTPIFASQQYVKDWTEVPLNSQNLKFEYNFKNLYAGEYVLGLRDSLGCEKTYPFTLDVDTNLFIPNIFTPNEDGYNDTFYIRNLPTDAKVLITNRWGNEVYKSSAYQNDWSGGDAVDGLYYYTVTVGKERYTGWVEILRAQ